MTRRSAKVLSVLAFAIAFSVLTLSARAAEEMGWSYKAGRLDGAIAKRAVLRADWYMYNDFGTLRDVRPGELTVSRVGDMVTADVWTGGGPVCSKQRNAVEVHLAFDTEERERQSWLVTEDRALFAPRDRAAFLERLRRARALWIQVSDGCGWPWRTELWIEDGHRYIEKVLAEP